MIRRMTATLLLVLAAIGAGCNNTDEVASQANDDTSDDAPIVTSTPLDPNSVSLERFKELASKGNRYSDTRWEVYLHDRAVRVRPYDPEADNGPALPFAVTRPVSADRTPKVLRVTDGWLVAWNAGEWGGQLWWFSPDGTESDKISNDQIVAFFEAHGRLFALEGLDHMLPRGPGPGDRTDSHGQMGGPAVRAATGHPLRRHPRSPWRDDRRHQRSCHPGCTIQRACNAGDRRRVGMAQLHRDRRGGRLHRYPRRRRQNILLLQQSLGPEILSHRASHTS